MTDSENLYVAIQCETHDSEMTKRIMKAIQRYLKNSIDIDLAPWHNITVVTSHYVGEKLYHCLLAMRAQNHSLPAYPKQGTYQADSADSRVLRPA